MPAEQDADPFYADDANQEQGTEDSCEQVATSNDSADAVDEGLPRHSQRTSRPPLRMTYDVPGQLMMYQDSRPSNRARDFSVIPRADIATLQSTLDVATCVETLLSIFYLHVPTCAVWAADSCTLLLLTSLGKWAVPVNLQEL